MQYAIGIDLGGTKVDVGLCSSDGVIVKFLREDAMTDREPQEVFSRLKEIVDELMTDDVIGVGFASPGFLNDEGVLVNAPNNPLFDGKVQLLKEFSRMFHMPVKHENDANCFALAEFLYGAGKGTTNMLGVIWGTGVGGGAIVNGSLYHGAHGGAAELGHTMISQDTNGDFLCVEDLCTGDFYLNRYHELGGVGYLTRKELMDSPEPLCKKVTSEMLQYMAVALSNWVHVLQPEMVVFGGGSSKTDFYEELQEKYTSVVTPVVGAQVRICKHVIGDNAGLLGAASLLFA